MKLAAERESDLRLFECFPSFNGQISLHDKDFKQISEDVVVYCNKV